MSLKLTVHDLTMKYDSVPVLDGVEFTMGQGEMTALIGPNGAGKSTLLRLISRILEPAGGAIFLNEREARSFTAGEIARQVAVVPQDTGVDFDFTVEEVVRMGRYPYRKHSRKKGTDDEQIVRSAMEATGILPLRHRSAATLSGGERQRMVFARALCQEPRLLLLDEPTANLDIGYQWEMLEIAARLNREKGMTVIAAIHDLNLAALFFRQFILLAGGKVLSLGSAEKVLTEKNIFESYRVPATIFRHPLHGRLQVSVHKKDACPGVGKKIHVVGGGREAIPVLELLQEKGYALSVVPVKQGRQRISFKRTRTSAGRGRRSPLARHKAAPSLQQRYAANPYDCR